VTRDPAISGIERVYEPRDERPGSEQDTARKDEEDLQHCATPRLDAARGQHDVERLLERPIGGESSQLGPSAPVCGLLERHEFEPIRAVEQAHLADGPAAERAVAVVQDRDPTRVEGVWLSRWANGTGSAATRPDPGRIGSIWPSRWANGTGLRSA
jgi:hypothetical protein